MSDHAKETFKRLGQDPMDGERAHSADRPDGGGGATAADQTAGKSGGYEGPGDPGLDAANPVEPGAIAPGEPETRPDEDQKAAALPSDAKGAT